MSDTSDTTPSSQVRVERLLAAPVEAVFDAWTDPASLGRWLSPTGRATAEVDARVGGRFRIVMLGEEMELEHTGRYLAIDPPRHLSFTWQSPYTGEDPSVVTVTLRPEGHQTRLVLVHEGLPADTALGHRSGWSTILGNLEKELTDATSHRREETGA